MKRIARTKVLTGTGAGFRLRPRRPVWACGGPQRAAGASPSALSCVHVARVFFSVALEFRSLSFLKMLPKHLKQRLLTLATASTSVPCRSKAQLSPSLKRKREASPPGARTRGQQRVEEAPAKKAKRQC